MPFSKFADEEKEQRFSVTKENLVQIKRNSSRKIIYQLILLMRKEREMEAHIFGSVTTLAREH